MRIVLASPPIADFYFTPHRFSSLGPALLVRRLEEAGHAVKLFSFPLAVPFGKRIPLPPAVSGLAPFIIENETGPLSFFTAYHRFGPPFEACASLIAHEKPDLIGISCFAYAYGQETVQLARAVKDVLPAVPVVAGGAGVTVAPGYFLSHGVIDFCIAGEGEDAICELARLLSGPLDDGLLDRIPNLLTASGGTAVPLAPERVTELDFVCVPTSVRKTRISFTTSIARGCSKECRFCTNRLHHGRQFRTVLLEKIGQGLAESAVGTRGKKIHINFEDDNLLLDPDYFLAVLQLCRQRFPSATFSAENGLDYTLLGPQLVDKLCDNGFTVFNLSLASGSPHILARQARLYSIERYTEIVSRIASRRVPAITYFIAGLQGDTKENIAQTLAFLSCQPTRIGISPFYAIPGMSGFENPALFEKKAPRLSLGSSLYPWTGTLSTQTLVTAFRLARFANLRKMEPAAEEGAIISFILKEKKLYTFTKEKKERLIFCVPGCDQELVDSYFNALADISH